MLALVGRIARLRPIIIVAIDAGPRRLELLVLRWPRNQHPYSRPAPQHIVRRSWLSPIGLNQRGESAERLRH
jgi:hypothetical protein